MNRARKKWARRAEVCIRLASEPVPTAHTSALYYWRKFKPLKMDRAIGRLLRKK